MKNFKELKDRLVEELNEDNMDDYIKDMESEETGICIVCGKDTLAPKGATDVCYDCYLAMKDSLDQDN